MKGSGWGCGFLVIILVIAGIGFLMDMASPDLEPVQAQSEQDSLDTIGKLADSNADMAQAIQQNGETINDLAGEVVEGSKQTRAENKELLGQNKLLIYVIGGLVVALILAMVLRSGGKKAEA